MKQLLFLTIIYITAASCSASNAETVETKETPVVKIISSTTVTTAPAEITAFEYLISSNGKIRSVREQLFVCEAPVRILQCPAQNNRQVSEGTVLARLDTIVASQKLERAEMARFNADKEYQSQLLGYENLLKGKTATEAASIKQKLRISTGLSIAEQEIKESRYELRKAIITAPFTGVLADVTIRQGQQMKTGESMFRLYDPHHFLLEVKVLEADVSLLKPGTTADVFPVSNPSVKYKAVLSEINPYVDENGMVQIRLSVTNPAGAKLQQGDYFFPGMNCAAVIRIPFQRALLIPKEGLVMRNGKAVVFTMENGTAKWNYVTTGRDNGKKVEILDGLTAGMKVIISNNMQLAHDAPVKEGNTDTIAVKGGTQ